MYNYYDLKQAESIKKIYQLQEIDDNTNYKEIESAFEHYWYYVNPLKVKYPFYEHHLRYKTYYKEEIEKYILVDDRSDELRKAIVQLRLIKEFFDEEYFNERLAHHKKYSDYECLREYMIKLDIVQLKEFLNTIMVDSIVFPPDEPDLKNILDRLNEECRKEDPTVPKITHIYDKFGHFQIQNPTYFFEYLNKKTIIDIFCENLKGDVKLRSAILARTMYLEGIEMVIEILVVWSL